MLGDSLTAIHFISFIAISLYLGGAVVWLRIRELKESCQTAQKEIIAQTKAATRLKNVYDQSRFEVEWLQATVQGSNSGTHFMEILKRWSSNPKSFYGWIIYDNSDWDGTHRDIYPEKLLQRFSCQATHLTLKRSQFESDFDDLPEEIDSITLFRTHQTGSDSCVIVISQIPNCFSQQKDFQLLTGFMKLVRCRSRNSPQKLIEFEDDLENLIAKEMLEIRSLLDNDFQSPVELMREFLQKLTILSGYTYASLYLSDQQGSDSSSCSHYASGGTLSSAEDGQIWQDAEKRFVDGITGRLDEMLILNSETILDEDHEVPFRCGLMIPIRQDEKFVGTLILTHASESIPSNEDAQLVEWASQFLMKTLDREISRVETVDQARRDALTNLANRRTFDSELNRFIERTNSSQENCTLIMLDIDHFKSINDKHGHPVGDQVLITVAESLQIITQKLRVTDHALPTRYGGEEFAIILPNVDLDGGLRIAEQIRKEIEELLIEPAALKLTASFGVACTDIHGKSYEELIHYADEALYAAKKSGRNCVCTTNLKKLEHVGH